MEYKNTEEINGTRVKILVVDDREDNLMSIESILEQERYEIVKANSGSAALKILLHQYDFTLILMDVQMPAMSGIETANLIYQREKLRHIPIIFITAHNYNDTLIYEGYKAGAVDYIYKPINPDLLRIKVGVFTELYRKNHLLMEQEKKLLEANATLANEIQERVMSEERVQALNQQLLENNSNLRSTIEELDRFAYVASHDLKEPLRKILMFSDKLLLESSGQIGESLVHYIEKIKNASERMQQLINDLLIFSMQQDNPGDFSEVDLNKVVEEVLTDMEAQICASGAIIRVASLPAVSGVASQLRQLFQNLIGNGIKFRKPGVKPLISIFSETSHIEMSDQRVDFHRIVVEDNGIGFDGKYANDIFIVFKRLHHYQEYEGTGVGLSICKKIVERHRGRIWAQGKLDKGSRFFIELPVIVSETGFQTVPLPAVSIS